MSRAFKNSSSNSAVASGVANGKQVSISKTPFCKHCDNLHLDTNHWLYSNGVLVCPVMKNTECTNCHKKGHTKSKCTSRSSEQKEKYPPVIAKKHVPMSVVLRNKYFALLEEEEDEEKRVEEHFTTSARAAPQNFDNVQFPVLGGVSIETSPVVENNVFSTKPSYSAILLRTSASPAPVATTNVTEPTETVELTDYIKRVMSFKKKSWADSDSEDEDEDEDNYFEN